VCPWDDYAPATIAFCERRLCAWVVEPSNAWSNVAYVLVGFWVLWRRRGRMETALTAIGVAAVLLGLGSFAFHATGIRVFEVVDVSGMYLVSGLALTFALQRLRGWSDAAAVACFVGLVVASSALMIALGNDGIATFALQVLAAIALEIHLRTGTPAGVGAWLLAAIGALVVGLGIWLLDVHGPLCDPDNHLLTGHAVWHVLTAVSVLCFFRFHERLRGAEVESPR
jgi:hypothetical protein